MAKIDPSSRFKLIDEALTAPGVCWITKTDKGPFIDTGIAVKFGEFGRVYLSVAAVREMAGLLEDDTEVSIPVEEPEEEKSVDDELRDLAVQLARIADRVPSAADGAQPEAASTVADADAPAPVEIDDSIPPVFDTDVADSPVAKPRANKGAKAAHRPVRKSTSNDGDKGSDVVPDGAGHDNPFRI